MKRICVLDASVLFEDPYAIFAFGDHEVVIPIAVIEGLDDKKRNPDYLGVNARKVAEMIQSLKGDLNRGIATPGGGILRIEINHAHPDVLPANPEKIDNRILTVCKQLQREHAEKEVVFITKSNFAAIKARALGIRAEEYRREMVLTQDLYKGYQEIRVPKQIIDAYYANRKLEIEALKNVEGLVDIRFNPWQFIILKGDSASQSAIGVVDGDCIRPLRWDATRLGYAIKPANLYQKFALELLLEPKVRMVTINGPAGTGKTLMALLAGLYLVDRRQFRKILAIKSPTPASDSPSLGALPGNLDEKLDPWMASFRDAMQVLFENMDNPDIMIRQLEDRKVIEYVSYEHIRGRNFPDSFIVVDETQNLNVNQVITAGTRGNNSKLVFLGDTSQIDDPYLNEWNNGLTHLIQRWMDSPISGHITFEKIERDELVEEMIRRMSRYRDILHV